MRAFILRESVERNTNTYIHRLYAYIVQSESESESEFEIVIQLQKHFFLFIIAFYCIHYDKLGDSQVDVFSFIDIIKFLFFAFCFVLFLELTYRLTAFSLNEDLDSSLALKTATPAHLLDCPQPPTNHQAEHPSPFLNLSLFVLAELPLSLPISPLPSPWPTSKGSP